MSTRFERKTNRLLRRLRRHWGDTTDTFPYELLGVAAQLTTNLLFSEGRSVKTIRIRPKGDGFMVYVRDSTDIFEEQKK